MNCQDFEKSVIALARNQLLDAAVREQGLIHTEACARCAARLGEERALMASMRAVVADLTGEEAPARVEAALLKAFRQRATNMPAVIPMPVRTRLWTDWRREAIAAGILILLSALAIFWRQSDSMADSPAVSPDQRREARTETPTPSVPPSPQTPPPTKLVVDRDLEELAGNPAESRSRKRARLTLSGNDSDETEVVTQFFPLREGEDLAALESAQLMRVELPGSALREVGLLVDPETASEPVKADVVLGQDGLARAIRFVR